LRERVSKAVDEKMTAITAEMSLLESDRRNRRFELVDKFKDDSEAIRAELEKYSTTMVDGQKKLAEKFNCKFVETPFITQEQLGDEEEYPIGTTTPPSRNAMQASGLPVYALAFAGYSEDGFPPTATFQAQRSSSNPFAFDLDENQSARHYIWWVIETQDRHEPTLDEEGIRDEVILTWKRTEARAKAQQRAEELAEKVRTGLAKPEAERQPMATSLEGVHVTESADSPVLTVHSTRRVSWMTFGRQSMRADRSMIEFADQPGKFVEYPGNDFYRIVFSELQNGEVGVAPSYDLSKYFVVEVADRTPADAAMVQTDREQFLRDGGSGMAFLFGPIPSAVGMEVATPMNRDWVTALWRKYDIDPTKIGDARN
ncbi:MAG: hypothetical protein KDA85_12110, partial [Planctomycetaceae bacterium]|nr:hypothetical protein [Planctomycetaceae bacterium]